MNSLQCFTCNILDARFPFPATSLVMFSGTLIDTIPPSFWIWMSTPYEIILVSRKLANKKREEVSKSWGAHVSKIRFPLCMELCFSRSISMLGIVVPNSLEWMTWLHYLYTTGWIILCLPLHIASGDRYLRRIEAKYRFHEPYQNWQTPVPCSHIRCGAQPYSRPLRIWWSDRSLQNYSNKQVEDSTKLNLKNFWFWLSHWKRMISVLNNMPFILMKFCIQASTHHKEK